jgi:hypothetical protein
VGLSGRVCQRTSEHTLEELVGLAIVSTVGGAKSVVVTFCRWSVSANTIRHSEIPTPGDRIVRFPYGGVFDRCTRRKVVEAPTDPVSPLRLVATTAGGVALVTAALPMSVNKVACVARDLAATICSWVRDMELTCGGGGGGCETCVCVCVRVGTTAHVGRVV